MAGLFITFEGLDGAGKTTQLKILAERLTQSGKYVLCTREPGGTHIGDKLREMLLDPHNREMDARTEALLYAATRAQHVAEVIGPALHAGRIVLCDRFIDSTLAYQGWGRSLNWEALNIINCFAVDGIMPDLTFFLDLEPNNSHIRLAYRCGDMADRIEQEHMSFRDRVYKGFQELAKTYPERFVTIEACGSAEDVHRLIWPHVERYLTTARRG